VKKTVGDDKKGYRGGGEIRPKSQKAQSEKGKKKKNRCEEFKGGGLRGKKMLH